MLKLNKDIVTDSLESGVMVINVGIGHGDMSSNPGWDWLHVT